MDIHHIGPEYISENISGVISGKTSPDMDIHHIGPEHISKNIYRAYLQKYLQSYLWKNISGPGYTSHWSGAYL